MRVKLRYTPIKTEGLAFTVKRGVQLFSLLNDWYFIDLAACWTRLRLCNQQVVSNIVTAGY